MSRTFQITIPKSVSQFYKADTSRVVTLRDLSNNILGTAVETPANSGQYVVTVNNSSYAYWYVDGVQQTGLGSPFWVGAYDSFSGAAVISTLVTAGTLAAGTVGTLGGATMSGSGLTAGNLSAMTQTVSSITATASLVLKTPTGNPQSAAIIIDSWSGDIIRRTSGPGKADTVDWYIGHKDSIDGAGSYDTAKLTLQAGNAGDTFSNPQEHRSLYLNAGNGFENPDSIGGNVYINPGWNEGLGDYVMPGNVVIAQRGGNVLIGSGSAGSNVTVSGNINATGSISATTIRASNIQNSFVSKVTASAALISVPLTSSNEGLFKGMVMTDEISGEKWRVVGDGSSIFSIGFASVGTFSDHLILNPVPDSGIDAIVNGALSASSMSSGTLSTSQAVLSRLAVATGNPQSIVHIVGLATDELRLESGGVSSVGIHFRAGGYDYMINNRTSDGFLIFRNDSLVEKLMLGHTHSDTSTMRGGLSTGNITVQTSVSSNTLSTGNAVVAGNASVVGLGFAGAGINTGLASFSANSFGILANGSETCRVYPNELRHQGRIWSVSAVNGVDPDPTWQWVQNSFNNSGGFLIKKSGTGTGRFFGIQTNLGVPVLLVDTNCNLSVSGSITGNSLTSSQLAFGTGVNGNRVQPINTQNNIVINAGTGGDLYLNTDVPTADVLVAGALSAGTSLSAGNVIFDNAPKYRGITQSGTGLNAFGFSYPIHWHAVANVSTLASTNVTNSNSAGIYRINAYLVTSTVSAGTTLTITWGWTDSRGARTTTDNIVCSSGSFTECKHVFLAGFSSSVITYAITSSGGGGAADLYMVVERII